VSWAEHRAYLDEHWEPGQHVSVIAPTGRGGKSFLITRGLLPLWHEARVLYLDVKDSDTTLFRFGHRVRHFPSRLRQDFYPSPLWFRLHVPSALGGGPSESEQSRVVYQAMAAAYKQKGWVIVADEVSVLSADLNLTKPLRDIWKRGRSQVTLIAATQSPRWVPGEMYDQPTYLYLGRLNAEGNKRLGEIGGTIDYREIRQILAGVRAHEFLFIDNTAEDGAMQIVNVRR
jgi:hypothetical protein